MPFSLSRWGWLVDLYQHDQMRGLYDVTHSVNVKSNGSTAMAHSGSLQATLAQQGQQTRTTRPKHDRTTIVTDDKAMQGQPLWLALSRIGIFIRSRSYVQFLSIDHDPKKIIARDTEMTLFWDISLSPPILIRNSWCIREDGAKSWYLEICSTKFTPKWSRFQVSGQKVL